MTISVAVTTRTKDRPAFLKRAIKSISEQTFKDYTHVIFNDGGNKKDIEDIVGGLPKNVSSKIEVFHRSVPSGAPDYIFNEAIDMVTSKYVAIHDDDDTWHPDFLAKAVEALEKGSDGVLVRTDRVYEKIDGQNINFIKSFQYQPHVIEPSLYVQCIENQLTPISFIYKRSVYKKIGKYDSTMAVSGDWEFGIRFLKETDVKFLDLGYALAFYHERKNTKDNSYASHNHRKHIIKVANKYLREDLAINSLGLGYIISNLKYDMDIRHGMLKKLVPKKLIELKKKIQG